MIWFKNIFCYVGWKSLHIPIVITKLSGLNLFICIYIISGRHRTIKCSSNQNVRSEYYDRLSYLPVKICICIPLRTLFAQTWYVISTFQREWKALLFYYYALHTVMSPMNETWGNLTALRSILHQRRLSSYRRLSPVQTTQCFWGYDSHCARLYNFGS